MMIFYEFFLWVFCIDDDIMGSYIGYTRTTLSRRLTMHLQSGAPLKHSQDFHNSTLNREQMVSNMSIIRQENDFNRLEIMEALYIKYTKPEINLQTTGRRAHTALAR